MCTLGFRVPSCRNLFKKPWAFIRVPYMNPTMLGLNAESFFIRFLHYIILKHHNELWGITMAKNFYVVPQASISVSSQPFLLVQYLRGTKG